MPSAKDYANLPLYSICLKLWRIFGFLDYDGAVPFRAIALSIIPQLTLIFQSFNLFIVWGDLELLVYDFFMFAIVLDISLRTLMVAYKSDDFVKFVKSVNDLYAYGERHGSAKTKNKLQYIVHMAQKLAKYSYGLACVVSMIVSVRPILKGNLVLNIHIPGIDVSQSPIYEICYILEVVFVVPWAIAGYSSFTNFLLASVMLGRTSLQDLQRKLNNLANADNMTMLRELRECVQYHNRIIKFRNDLEGLVAYASLADVGLFAIMLCMVLFCTVVADDTSMIITSVFIMLVPLSMVGMTYWCADEFANESLKVANAVYNVNWVEGDKNVRHFVLLMLIRSQRPLQLTTGGIQPLTMEVFQGIIRISYSYFSLLQGLI